MRRVFTAGALVGLVFTLGVLVLSTLAQAGPPPGGRPDPRQMSGLPRIDPQVAPGSLTVRVLNGSFSEPAIGQTVKLELSAADGTKKEIEAATVDQGRATFSGLDDFIGGEAIAVTEFEGGEVVRSKAMPIDARAGTRVMLVKGATNAAGGGAGMGTGGPGPAGGMGGGGMHGGAGAVPMPGRAFPLDDRPVGTVVVGVLDLEAMKPLAGVEVRLEITVPAEEGAEKTEPEIRTEIADEEGRAVFTGLETLPEKATLVAETTLPPVGDQTEGTPKRSQPFTIDGKALAVILARGGMEPVAAGTGAGPGPVRPKPLPGPTRDRSLQVLSVKVVVVDPKDEPVAEAAVELVRRDMTGKTKTYKGSTDQKGEVLFEDLDGADKGLYFAGVHYGGAPWRSTFFELPEDSGAKVAMRVWPTTRDARVVRSAVQFDFEPRENDRVQVTQEYMALVDGDKAFWSPNLYVTGADGAIGLQVLPNSDRHLELPEEESPFAKLLRPIPPGTDVRLSVAYLLDHDGKAELVSHLPFTVVQGVVTVPQGIELIEGAQGAPRREQDGQGLIDLYEFQPTKAFQPGICDPIAAAGYDCPPLLGQGSVDLRFVVDDLPRGNPWFMWVALGVASALAATILISFILAPKVGAKDALERRREELLAELGVMRASGRDIESTRDPEVARVLDALDRIYAQLDALRS